MINDAWEENGGLKILKKKLTDLLLMGKMNCWSLFALFVPPNKLIMYFEVFDKNKTNLLMEMSKILEDIKFQCYLELVLKRVI